MQRTLLSSVLLVVLSVGLAGQSIAEESATAKSAKPVAIPPPPTTEERLERLERLINSQGLVDILLRLENLQKDVQNIQGDNEVQMHKLDEIRKRQRELYIDIDRRLLQLERKQTGRAPVAVDKSKSSTPAQTAVTAAATAKVAGGGASNSTHVSGTVVGGKPTGGRRTAVAAKPVVGEPEQETEQEAYQKAFNLLRELRYDKAGLAFRAFIEKYPEGRYAHIAQYWLAEASYAQRDFKTAIADYQKLIDDYAGSPKRAEAMLKIGYSYYELKDYPKAQAVLEQLLAAYPGTTEAGQAQNLLQKIKINNAS